MINIHRLGRVTGSLGLSSLVLATALAMSTLQVSAGEPSSPPTQWVVMHHPGPLWKPGVSAFEQPGLKAHIDHYAKLYEMGKLALGGPFLDDEGGGMMIARPGMSRQEIVDFAAADPAVHSGLLTFTVRAWMIGMDASAAR